MKRKAALAVLCPLAFIVGCGVQFGILARSRNRHMVTIDILLTTAKASMAHYDRTGRWPTNLTEMAQRDGAGDWWHGWTMHESDAWGRKLEYHPYDINERAGYVRSATVHARCWFLGDGTVLLREEGRPRIGLFRVRWTRIATPGSLPQPKDKRGVASSPVTHERATKRENESRD